MYAWTWKIHHNNELYNKCMKLMNTKEDEDYVVLPYGPNMEVGISGGPLLVKTGKELGIYGILSARDLNFWKIDIADISQKKNDEPVVFNRAIFNAILTPEIAESNSKSRSIMKKANKWLVEAPQDNALIGDYGDNYRHGTIRSKHSQTQYKRHYHDYGMLFSFTKYSVCRVCLFVSNG